MTAARIRVWQSEWCDCQRLVERARGEKLFLCDECTFVAREQEYEVTEAGARVCPVCKSKVTQLPPFRVCEHCGHYFFVDDARGTEEPGVYLCPRCQQSPYESKRPSPHPP